jgi:hypothetical protein
MRGRIRVIAAIRIWRSFGAKLWAISALPSPGESHGESQGSHALPQPHRKIGDAP